MKLTTHIHLELRLRISGAIRLYDAILSVIVDIYCVCCVGVKLSARILLHDMVPCLTPRWQSEVEMSTSST